MYHLIRFIHQFCALASVSLFILRGVWMLRDSPQRARRWVRILPHVVDTVLLASAVALTLLVREFPLAHAWLTAKLLGLLAYIALGLLALRYGRTKSVRATAWVGALLVFSYIVSVARSHNPLGFFAM